MTDKFFDEQDEDREPAADSENSFLADLDKEQIREEGLCPGDPDEPLPADALHAADILKLSHLHET